MRIHTNTPNAAALATQALKSAKDAGLVAASVYFDKLVPGGSRTHNSAVEAHLVSWAGGKGTTHPRRPNSGTFGADGGDDWAATYDEWGWFLAALFELDPSAKAGQYTDLAEFTRRTAGKYSAAPVSA